MGYSQLKLQTFPDRALLCVEVILHTKNSRYHDFWHIATLLRNSMESPCLYSCIVAVIISSALHLDYLRFGYCNEFTLAALFYELSRKGKAFPKWQFFFLFGTELDLFKAPEDLCFSVITYTFTVDGKRQIKFQIVLKPFNTHPPK